MLHGSRLRLYSLLTVVFLVGGFALAAFWAPMDADQGFMQKIFYVHVPMAITALIGFVAGGWFAIQYLRKGDSRDDLRSYVAIHIAVVLGVGVLLTGALWAKASWGRWFVWDEPTLTSFLIVFLLYCTYTPLRFSIPEPERQARYAAVFAVIGGAFVPLNFLAVRLAEPLIHPRTLNSTGSLPTEVRTSFFLSLIGMILLFITLCKYEMASKNATAQMRALRRKLGGDDGGVAKRTAAPTVDVP
ncbi:MAG TPA: cytochrome c biogenesis protein CcsA [Baekduia sp.]|nr:cytochrome c biogenesis protein CcsA [Baekduia sp.]